MARYQIWNKQDTIYTPIGEIISPEEWIDRYGWINNPAAIPVVSGGLINGSYMGELSEMKSIYEKMGADFSNCKTNEDILVAIEEFEDAQNAQSAEPSVQERTAAALEFIAMNSLPDME